MLGVSPWVKKLPNVAVVFGGSRSLLCVEAGFKLNKSNFGWESFSWVVRLPLVGVAKCGTFALGQICLGSSSDFFMVGDFLGRSCFKLELEKPWIGVWLGCMLEFTLSESCSGWESILGLELP